MRTELKTARGTVFPIISETEHYVLCGEPNKNKAASNALLDFEDLYGQGLRLCSIASRGRLAVFEKVSR